jgi:uncharacterized protein
MATITRRPVASPEATAADRLRDLARTLAARYARARRSFGARSPGMPDELRRRWTENLDRLRALTPHRLEADVVDEMAHLALTYVYGRHPLLVSRVEAGKIRALDPVAPCDGLEAAAGVALELERHGPAGAADAFLAWFAEFSAEARVDSLLHHYVAHRAIARLGADGRATPTGPVGAATVPRDLAGIALTRLRAAEPRMILVGGTPGTGKSTLAEALSDRLGAVLLRSDRIRVTATPGPARPGPAQPWPGRSPAHDSVHDTYDELLAVAGRLLGYGESVVLDAAWSTRGERAQARDAAGRAFSPVAELRCEAPPAVVDARAAVDGPDGLSPEVARVMEREFHPWPQARVLSTTVPVDRVVARALASVLTPCA